MFLKVLTTAALLCLVQGRKTTWRDLEKNLEYSFEDYCKEFMLSFLEEERYLRKGIFEQNLKKIRQHNKRKDSSYKMGVNQFAHMTSKEFKESFVFQIALIFFSNLLVSI